MRSIPLALWLCACATASPPTASEVPRPCPHDDPLQQLNQRARKRGVSFRIGDMLVEDPFRALESESELTDAWIDAQSQRTDRELSRLIDPAAQERLSQLLGIGSIDDVGVGGTRMFVKKREGEREQPALYLLDGGVLQQDPLIDPEQYGERASLDWFYPSPTGRYVAFGVADSGDERAVLRIFDVDARKVVGDPVEHAKWSSVSWLHDESGFYYTRYPKPGEARYDPEQQDTYFPAVFHRKLGGPDVLVFQSDVAEHVPAAAVSEDDRYVTVMNFHGWTASEVYLLDRDRDAGADKPPLRRVALPEDARASAVVHRGKLYILTNADAPRWRILQADPERADEASALSELIPQSAGTIEDFLVTGDRIAVKYVEDVRSRLRLFDLQGKAAGEAELPTRGSLESIDAAASGGPIALVFSSFFHPPTLYSYEPHSAHLGEVYQVSHDLDLDAYVLSQAEVASADGTQINVYYVHGKGLQRDRDNPVLLYGYGGFDVSLLPTFTRTALYWIERGGVYAVANLRGGGEFGERWHKAGMLEHKERVFEDFEAVVKWLSESGLSRPERIALTGGSNGGLLMGAMITRIPEHFAATAAYVGLYDMLRYHLFPPAKLWTSEYGDPEDTQAARYLRKYSPYHNVRDGVAYPAVLIEAADHDTRVFWGHSTKFAAQLQTSQAGDKPIYFYMQRDQGHGRGTRHSDLVDKLSRRQAFLEAALSVGESALPKSPTGAASNRAQCTPMSRSMSSISGSRTGPET